MNLYPPGVWFEDTMTSFPGVTFVLFCFVSIFMLWLKPRPFVQSSFDICRRPDSHTCFFLSFRFVYLEISFFPSIFVPSPFYLCMESTSYVLSFRVVFFYPVTTGCIMQERGFIRLSEIMETLLNGTLDNKNIETLVQGTPNRT